MNWSRPAACCAQRKSWKKRPRAIVLDREGAGEGVYLVRETKGDGELRPTEAMKVECGAAHFEGALGVSYARVSTASEIT
jgi:restriction endonuclease